MEISYFKIFTALSTHHHIDNPHQIHDVDRSISVSIGVGGGDGGSAGHHEIDDAHQVHDVDGIIAVGITGEIAERKIAGTQLQRSLRDMNCAAVLYRFR